jgi:sialate O-acetylesterase
VLGLAVLLSVTAVLRADEFRVNRLFSDRMVLQRDHPVRIFGTGAGDAVVTVSLGGARAPAARVGEEWMATLPALPAGGPYTLTIDGPRRIRFSDVWLGDVWVCGGQSNMRQELREIPEFVANPTVWARAEVRLLRSAYQRNPAPARDLVPAAGYEAGWQIATADTLREFSAAGFHFGGVVQREGRAVRRVELLPEPDAEA